MSAFVVSRAHLDVIVRAGLDVDLAWSSARHDPVFGWAFEARRLNICNADAVGRMLAAENIASVCARYEDETADGYDELLAYRYRPPGFSPTVAEALKALACFEYQSCEHAGWADSEVRRFCASLRDELVSRLPGYDEAPWAWADDELRARRATDTTTERRIG